MHHLINIRQAARSCWLLLLLAGACQTPSIPSSLPVPVRSAETLASREFRLGPNDIVRVGVHGHPELSTPASQNFDGTRVDPDGHLSLPLIGVIPVQGLTLNEARGEVTLAYAKFLKEPRVDFSVIEFASRRFYLYGEVNEPGAVAMDRPLNVYQALALSGGFTTAAARNQIVLLRETPDEVEVHVINGEQLEAMGLMNVRPEDFIFVMRSGSGRFRDEALPILTGISSAMSSIATVLLIEDRLN